MGAVRVIGGSLVRRKMLGERMKGKIIVKVSGAMLVFFGFLMYNNYALACEKFVLVT